MSVYANLVYDEARSIRLLGVGSTKPSIIIRATVFAKDNAARLLKFIIQRKS